MAGIVLAEAAGVYGNKYVCQTQSYGPEARGGTSKAEVVISNKPIDYPNTIKPDVLLAMNQASTDTYFRDLKPEGLLVVDSTLVKQIPTTRVVAIPFTQIARNNIGKEIVANIVALGTVGYLCQLVTMKMLEAALMTKVPKGWKEINRKALRLGIKSAKNVSLDALPRTVIPEEEEL
jgi:2-oxoglutarate ferredoxin oxidoreductase subunit gamma